MIQRHARGPVIAPRITPRRAVARRRALRWFLGLIVVTGLAACVPKAASLVGAPAAPMRIPRAELVRMPQLVAFTWRYEDPDIRAQGEGAARVTWPDSARLDLFLSGGLGGGMAVIIGDSLVNPPGGGLLKRFLPPVAMFWASLGRLAVPGGDTAVRVDGATTRADIARGGRIMRVTFEGERLTSLEHIVDGGILERVTRGADRTEYVQNASRRRLTLVISRTTNVPAFDSAIWH